MDPQLAPLMRPLGVSLHLSKKTLDAFTTSAFKSAAVSSFLGIVPLKMFNVSTVITSSAGRGFSISIFFFLFVSFELWLESKP